MRWGILDDDGGYFHCIIYSGEPDAGLTYIKDLAAGKYKLPWEDEMDIKDGSIYGYPTTGGRFGTEPEADPYGIHEYKGLNYHGKK